jgi:hypothetical protein
MSDRKVGRPATAVVAKEHSTTATRAYVAGRLAQTTDADFLRGLGVALNSSAISRAGRATLWHPADYKPRGRVAHEPTAIPRTVKAPEPALHDWLAVNADALELRAFIVQLAFENRAEQLAAYRKLQRMIGIVHVITLSSNDCERRRLMATALIDDDDDRDRLAKAFRCLTHDWSWSQVKEETLRPALLTWSREQWRAKASSSTTMSSPTA